MKTVFTALLLCLGSFGGFGNLGSPQPVAAQSPLTLWLWHGAHDLRGLSSETQNTVDVAFLATTLEVGRRLRITGRRDPVLLDPDTRRIAVVHIELDAGLTVIDVERHFAELQNEVNLLWQEHNDGIQVDFDAPESFRGFYGRLLEAVEAQRPPHKTLSITALGSWCLSSGWLAGIPANIIVVPMLFGSGHSASQMHTVLARGPLAETRCNEVLGIRDGDPSPSQRARIFVFYQGGWDLSHALRVWRHYRGHLRVGWDV